MESWDLILSTGFQSFGTANHILLDIAHFYYPVEVISDPSIFSLPHTKYSSFYDT